MDFSLYSSSSRSPRRVSFADDVPSRRHSFSSRQDSDLQSSNSFRVYDDRDSGYDSGSERRRRKEKEREERKERERREERARKKEAQRKREKEGRKSLDRERRKSEDKRRRRKGDKESPSYYGDYGPVAYEYSEESERRRKKHSSRRRKHHRNSHYYY